MTMIDEGVLSELLHDAAQAFDVSAGATDRILAEARTAAPTPRSFGRRTPVPRSGKGRLILVAAVVALVIGGVTFSVARAPVNGSASSRSAGIASFGGAAIPATPSTTSPGVSGSKTVSPIPPGAIGQPAKVEANGSVDLTIGDGALQTVLARLTDLAVADGGFVSSDQAQFGAGSSSTGTVVLRVPQLNFEALVTQVQRVGDATSVTTTAEDVTGQYVDLQARIKALQASRQQYLTIMTRATSIGDILAVQSQLDTLQSQIEQLQGQLDLLNNETSYGTLTVSLTEAGQRHHAIPPPQPGSGIGKAWHDSVSGFVSGFEWLIRIGGPLLFVLLCLAALAILGRLAWRATRRRML